MHNYVILYEHAEYNDEEYRRGIVRRKIQIDYSRDILREDTCYFMNCMYINGMNLHIREGDITQLKLGIDKAPPGYCIKSRCADGLVLNFVISGKGKMDQMAFQEGEFYFTLPMQTHSLFADSKDPWFTVWLQVSGPYSAVLQSELEAITATQKGRFSNANTILQFVRVLLYEGGIGCDVHKFAAGLISILFSYLSAEKRQEQLPGPSRQQRLIQKAIELIHTYLSTITVAGIAKSLNLDRRYFSQLFHEVMNITPQQYIQNCKMDYIKNVLITTPLSIDEIVDATGYGHRNSLVTAFRKRFGCSPTQYRVQYFASMKHAERDP